MAGTVRRDIRVEGIVQGVGFRPFVYGIATRFGLAGRVGNDVAGVFIEIEGPEQAVADFLVALRADAPPLADIERVTVADAAPAGTDGFTIAESDAAGARATLVSADSATCADCLRELFDPADRRYRYPFVNCTNCGPRFTIVRDVPYDRSLTTMASFDMCPPCAAEYHDPADRRFHAQPTCCPKCGPKVRLLPDSAADPIVAAGHLLRDGRILAVKGLGGYHLAALAADESAAARLRARKHREDKPFAVMVSDVDEAAALGSVDDTARQLLTGRRRPIVLLPRRQDAALARSVAPGNRHIGVMLPYTPLHHLLLEAVGQPIVLTSGNVSDEPIAYRDSEATERLRPIADVFLVHDRAIHIRTDDSVVRPWRGTGAVLRRSRGYVPEPVALPLAARRPVLACGAELKNTFCLAKGAHAFISHHIGDLENYETLRSFTSGIEHMRKLFEVDPALVAYDMHPEYLSTKHALDLAAGGLDSVGVQHHHAHIASCLADNGVTGPVIGVAFDGTGYGLDGTIWGGEFLLADLTDFRRAAHLAPVPMPGGVTAIRQPWRMAVAYLDAAYRQLPVELDVLRRNADRWGDVIALARSGTQPRTSSAGRLFDAISSILGVRDAIRYEGQAAIELEQLADRTELGSYPVRLLDGDPIVVRGVDLVRGAVTDLCAGVDTCVIAGRVHNGLADVIVACCGRLRDTTGVGDVALSGGVFQNLLLTNRVVDRLQANGFQVLTHARVPTNDGGISLGQAAIAAARDARR